jgi:hypothetical protein
MASGDGLGRVLNVIKTASGLDIPLSQAGSVTYVFGDAGVGAAIATVTQTDSTGTNSEIDLNIFTVSGTVGSNGESRAFVGPDTGGVWLENGAADFADNTFDLSDETTNDTGVFTVRSEQLSDGYDRVQVTVDTGTCMAILHDLRVQRKPQNLKSNLTV